MTGPLTAKRAAAVIPRLPDGRVLVGTRTGSARSWPGYTAFPGGAVEDSDAALPLLTDPEDRRAREERAGGLRELGEECGIWLLATTAGDAPSARARGAFDDALARGRPVDEALAAGSLVFDDRRLHALARFTTPVYQPIRFSVRQLLLVLDEEPHRGPACDELEDVRWVAPVDLEAAWKRGDALLLPPIRYVVRGLAAGARAGDSVDALAARLAARKDDGRPEPRDIVAGVAVEPFRTPTLPPATTTNAVLLGEGDFLVVDPATPYDDERQRFDALLAALADQGRVPRAIVLTHHHHDHTGDVERLRARGLPVWAHAETASRVPFPVERLLKDGEMLDGRVRAVFTPGHAPGHLCFLDEPTGVLVAGDMVAAVGSILIDPPEGHMGTYLESLARLIDGPARRVVPAHGPLLAEGRRKLTEHLDHRRARHRQVLDALPIGGPGATADELAAAIYAADTPPALLPLAARSVAAILELCVEQGAAVAHDHRFSRPAP